MNVFLHETFSFSCICMCRKPGILPLFDNAVVTLFSWFYGMRMRRSITQG